MLAQEGGKDRFAEAVTGLSKAFALAVPSDEAIRIRDDVGFFQAVRAGLAKTSLSDHEASGDLDHAIRQIVSNAIEAAQVIEELIALAGVMRAARRRGEELGLSHDELAFYDALGVNDSAVKVLGDAALRAIARELVDTVRRNVSIDWTVKESVRAKLRVIVKRILRKHGYPPDKQEAATSTVLQQAELLSDRWTEAPRAG